MFKTNGLQNVSDTPTSNQSRLVIMAIEQDVCELYHHCSLQLDDHTPGKNSL